MFCRESLFVGFAGHSLAFHSCGEASSTNFPLGSRTFQEPLLVYCKGQAAGSESSGVEFRRGRAGCSTVSSFVVAFMGLCFREGIVIIMGAFGLDFGLRAEYSFVWVTTARDFGLIVSVLRFGRVVGGGSVKGFGGE